MQKEASSPGYGIYLKIWLVLLGLTVVMVFLDQANLPHTVLATILVTAMLIKGTLIAGYFMHLKYDGILLILTLALGFGFFAAILYILMVPDALAIHGMVTSP